MSKSVALENFPELFPSAPSEMRTEQENVLKIGGGHVDDVFIKRQTQNWNSTNVSGWRRGAIHVEEADEDVNLTPRAFSDKGCVNKNTLLFHRVETISHVPPPAALPRRHPSPSCSGNNLVVVNASDLDNLLLRASHVKGKLDAFKNNSLFPSLSLVVVLLLLLRLQCGSGSCLDGGLIPSCPVCLCPSSWTTALWPRAAD